MGRVAQIVSTARYLPAHVVTNAELTARFAALGRPTVIDRLGASSGITQRFYAPDDWVTSDLAFSGLGWHQAAVAIRMTISCAP
jgi:3-oxoacyl-[acyl-carrier-protein] synthase-3